ncbi:MAG: CCA tRNA nucleotidyltransferase, partial [Planctomycetes bacterium]|nr:CCA tRNA nucleotidyltransferase [Planctomycetota bacterium]
MSAAHKDARLAALRILEKLRARGHTALLAGGCVRDMLLSIPPKDYDVATDATPKRVVRIFPRSRTVGAKFGVVLVRQYGHDIEVATFRSDGTYSDGRHPDTVVFGTDVEDARRRDFTINGLFFDPIEERVIDHVDGRRDLEAGVIRTIGEPEARFAEDHLRMLRAIRFAARLGFVIEPRTMAAIKCLAQRLGDISTERVWLELEA